MPDTENSDCRGDVRALARRDFYQRWMRRLACLRHPGGLERRRLQRLCDASRKHLTRQAREFFAAGDYQSAVLVARRVLRLNQNNVAACRRHGGNG